MNRLPRLGLLLLSMTIAPACTDTVAALTEAVSPSAPVAPAVPGHIAGRWATRWGSTQICNLILSEDGANITGTYTTIGAPPGTVQGTFASNVLSGTWTDQQGSHGGMTLTFTPDTSSFTGTWGSGDSSTNGGSWTGRR